MRSAASTLTRLGHFAPYFVVELLLPGATLVALLLWLSRNFMRNGLRDVRQHMYEKSVEKPVIIAKARVKGLAMRLCGKRCAVVRLLRDSFRQWCESVLPARQCCAR
jgi:hypothetical protein